MFKADLADEEVLELVELEVRELLEGYGFDGDKSPVIKGSALLALKGDSSKYGTPSIQALLDALDNFIPTPKRDYNSPFILPIDNVFNVPGRGTVVVGTIKRGVIKKGSEADLIGFDQTIKTFVTDVQVKFFFNQKFFCPSIKLSIFYNLFVYKNKSFFSNYL